MEHIDKIFDIQNINTIWSPGNHDYSNPDLIKFYTKRDLFYAYHKSNITFIIFDTQDSISSITHEQLDMFNNVVFIINNLTKMAIYTLS